MAINSPRIVAGPTVSREKSYINCLPLYLAVPTQYAIVQRWNVDTLSWESVTLLAGEIQGLIAVVTPGSFIANLYSAVNGSWVPVSIVSEFIDPGTGKEWDPLARFYTPLAS